MFKKTKTAYNKLGALIATGIMIAGGGGKALAADPPAPPPPPAPSPPSVNNFGSIAKNITTSIADVPGLLTALSYMFGILLGVLGVMKIKDHVENPTQTALKDGAIRLAAGGALFALPILFEAMSTTIGNGTAVDAAQLNKVKFHTLP